MTTIKRTIEQEVEIIINGKELADLFWSMSELDQSHFFNQLGECSGLSLQLNALMNSPALTDRGRFAMARIGEYAYQ